MPLQNRVLPTGEIVAIAARGTMTGNRGILHGPDRMLGKARWRHKAWICCVLDWQGRKRKVMTGRNWTELFFHDEAVAFAAGHRPCAYCRRDAYNRFQAAWARAHGQTQLAPVVDHLLHGARVGRDRKQITYQADFASLPDGTFVATGQGPALIWQGGLWRYDAGRYVPHAQRPIMATVLTPRPIVAVLAAGYVPKVTLPC